MTRYTVVWHNTARDELARLWLASSDKQAVTDAANGKVDPDIMGLVPSDPGHGILRVTFRPPIGP